MKSQPVSRPIVAIFSTSMLSMMALVDDNDAVPDEERSIAQNLWVDGPTETSGIE